VYLCVCVCVCVCVCSEVARGGVEEHAAGNVAVSCVGEGLTAADDGMFR
jgi:hypothetical protein